jgi:hypothetical protein
LGAIARDPGVAATVARASYWHANGFAKLVLHDSSEPNFHLRLHVWAAEHETAPHWAGYYNIHTHRWEFASVILAGALHVDLFAEIPDLREPKSLLCDKFEYISAEPEAAGQLVPVGPQALRLTGSTDYEAGDVHYCDLRTTHAAAPVDRALTATIFVQGPTRARSALVYQENGREALQDTGATITPAEVADLVSATLAAMNRAEG